MTQPLLRPATAADVPAITALVRAAYSPWTPIIGREARPLSVDYGSILAEHRFDLLEEGGALVALIETFTQPDCLVVQNIAVDPALHGRGVGQRLLAHAESLARAANRPALRLFTNALMARNIAIYEAAGYWIERREALEIGGSGVYMIKVLDAAERRIVFLPGAGADPDFWKPLGERLPARWIKTWLGWPGLGHQRASPQVNGWADLVAIAETAIGEGPPCDLVAQSMGGYVALSAALRRPGQVRRLVLAVTSGGVDTVAMGAAPWRETYRLAYPQAPAWLDGPAADLSARLPSLSQPALLLWGDADPISPVAVGRRLASLLPNAGLRVVAGGDHDIVQTHAAELAPAVAEFLS